MSEMSALARSIGQKIRQCRLERNLTQEDLAKGLFSKSYISQLERGAVNPSLKALRLLAERLGVSHTWLLETENSPPSLLIQAATTSYYLGDVQQAGDLLDQALQHRDDFTRRDQIEALLLEAGLAIENQAWQSALDTCDEIDKLIKDVDFLPRRHIVSLKYLMGAAWFHLGNRRQAIRHWEIGLDELNRCVGPPTPEGMSLLQALEDLYSTLGDHHASQNLQSRLVAAANQVMSPGDLSRWVLARRREIGGHVDSKSYPLVDQTEDLKDAEAWARAHQFLTTVAEIRESMDSKQSTSH